MQTALNSLPHIKNPCGARAQQPLVSVGSQKVDVLDRGGKRAEGLNGIDAEENVAFLPPIPAVSPGL